MNEIKLNLLEYVEFKIGDTVINKIDGMVKYME